jgi:aldehyde dehydrogenase (NAD+)
LLSVFDPVTSKVITRIASASAKDVDAAVQAAKAAYKSSWGLKVPGHERGRLLGKLADLVEKHLDELSALEALDGGKPFLHAKTMDLPGVIACLRYYAGWADKNYGKTIETSEAKFAYTRHEPIGVCGLIVPWNFPRTSGLGNSFSISGYSSFLLYSTYRLVEDWSSPRDW